MSFTSCKASRSSYRLLLSNFLRASSIFFPCCAMLVVLPRNHPASISNVNAHATRRASDDTHCSFYGNGFEVYHLRLSNLADLLRCYLPNLFATRRTSAFHHTCCLL